MLTNVIGVPSKFIIIIGFKQFINKSETKKRKNVKKTHCKTFRIICCRMNCLNSMQLRNYNSPSEQIGPSIKSGSKSVFSYISKISPIALLLLQFESRYCILKVRIYLYKNSFLTEICKQITHLQK